MAIKHFFLVLLVLGLACAAPLEVLEIMPLDTLQFSYLKETPVINGIYDATHEECDNARTFDDLFVRTCYRENHLYVYFSINDLDYDKNDSFYMGFDVDKDNVIEKSEPKITIFRNGSATKTSYAFTYDTVNSSKYWKGEIAVFFEDLNLPLNITPAKVSSGPNIRIKAIGGSEGTIGEFYNSGLGKMHSDDGWATPKDLTCNISPKSPQTWYPGNASVINMISFKVPSNNEEPIMLNSITIKGNGTGNEKNQIKQVMLYRFKNPSYTWVANGTFNSDNGIVIFPINIQIKGDDVGNNASRFDIFYKLDEDAGSVQSGNTSIPGTFMLEVKSVSGTGIFTGETINASNVPFYSSLLTTYDCVTDANCSAGQVCSSNICVSEEMETPPSEPPAEEPSTPPSEEPTPPSQEPSGPGEQPSIPEQNITPPSEQLPAQENATAPNVTGQNITTNESGIPPSGNVTGPATSGASAPFEIDSSVMVLAAAILIFLAALIIYLKKGKS